MSKSNYRVVAAALSFLACAYVCAPGRQANDHRAAELQTSAGWVSLHPEGEEFAAAFPQPPVAYSSWTTYSDLLLSHMEKKRSRAYGASADGVVYVVMSFKGHGQGRGRPDKVIESFVNGVKKDFGVQLGGTRVELIFERDLTLNTFKGKQYRVSINGVPGVVRCYVAKDHLYLLEAVGGDESNSSVRRFLSSFTLGERPDAPAAEPAAAAVEPPRQVTDAPDVFSSSEVDRKALIVLRREARYTDEARRRGVRGVVAVRAVLAASGKVTDVEVVKGLPHGLSEAASEATREMKFVPASKDGGPVSQRIRMEYAFNRY